VLELQKLPRWLGWKFVSDGDRIRKQPIDLKTGGFASCDNPETWCSYELAKSSLAAGKCDSIGLALGKELGLVIVDLDKVRSDKDEPFPKWVTDLVDELDSYTEISASGLGLHILVRGSIPSNINRQVLHVELHDSKKMFAISENLFQGKDTIETRDVTSLYHRVEDGLIGPHHKPDTLVIHDTSAKFREVCNDQWEKHGFDSRSAAVASALVSLAYKYKNDRDKIRAHFEKTPLCIAWEEKGKWTRLADKEISRAINFAKEHATAETAEDILEAADLLVGSPVPFDPREYALKPLLAPGQKFSGWFPRGRFTIIAGASGAMKTTFAAQALVSGRDGKTFLNHEPGRLPFMFLFADRGRYDVEETFERMGMAGKVPFKCINGLGRAQNLRTIADAASRFPVLFIDGGDLLVEDNNDGTSVAEFATAMQRVAEHYGTAMVVSTGAGKMAAKVIKEGGERRSIVKGSEVWSRTGGTVFTLNSEHDGTYDTRRLIVQHRNATTERYLLELRDGILVEVDEAKLEGKTADARLLEWVKERDSFTRAEAAKAHTYYNGGKLNERLNGLVASRVLVRKTRAGRDFFEVVSSMEAAREAERKARGDFELACSIPEGE
jgi:KaiC/GvpD/RAD55 family RecA-like ATPase